MNRKALLIVSFLIEGGLILIGLLLIARAQIGLLSIVSVSWSATAYALLLSVPMFAALYIVQSAEWQPLSQLNKEIEEKIRPIFSKCRIIDLGLIALLAGVGEELFFRGWLQNILIDKTGLWAGIVLASASFGLAHYISREYALYATLTGLYLGVIYQASGNLYIVTAMHALYDFIALLFLVVKGRKLEKGKPADFGEQRS